MIWQDRCLVGVRSANGPLGGYAEFPGGKCNADERPRATAERECLEETGVTVQAAEELAVITHKYPHGTVELHFWQCRPVTDNTELLLSQPLSRGFSWVRREMLTRLAFPPANATVITKLTAVDCLPPGER